MKFKLLTLLLVVFSFNSAFAQFGYGKIEDIETVQNVPLIIVTQVPSDKVIKKLNKKQGPEAVEKYKADLVRYNQAVEAAFNSTWKFSDEIKYVPSSEMEQYEGKENKEKYAIFKMVIDYGDNGFSMIKSKGLIDTFNYALLLAGKKKPVFSIMYTSSLPNEADFTLMAQQFEQYFKIRRQIKKEGKKYKEVRAEVNKNSGKLTSMLLLVDKKDLKDNVIDIFSTHYAYDHKFVEREAIDQAILNRTENTAYLRMMPVGQISGTSGPIKSSKIIFVQYIIDANTGETLAFITPSGVGLGGALGTSLMGSKRQMKEKDLMKIVQTIKDAH